MFGNEGKEIILANMASADYIPRMGIFRISNFRLLSSNINIWVYSTALLVVLCGSKISSLKLRKYKDAGCFKNSICRRIAESNVGEIKEARREMSSDRLHIPNH